MRHPIIAVLALGASLATGLVQAEAQVRASVRGTVDAINGETVEVMTRQGVKVTVDLTASTKFGDVSYAKITDIQPGSFVGTAAVPQPDGSLKALEVHVFAPDLRGSGEGSRPWEGNGRKGSMTNGTVGDVVVTNGRTMTVRYKGGEKTIVVPADVPIVYIEAGKQTDIVTGSHIIALGEKGADGSLAAMRVLVGRNGVVPPM
jgi:hypothetical protein